MVNFDLNKCEICDRKRPTTSGILKYQESGNVKNMCRGCVKTVKWLKEGDVPTDFYLLPKSLNTNKLISNR